jgi:hypothetical protein
MIDPWRVRGARILERILWSAVVIITANVPLVGTADAWAWIPFGNAFCANGSTTGLGVSKGTSTRLVIFLQAGGACWSSATCYGSNPPAAFTTGYGAANFAKSSRSTSLLAEPGGFFDRGAAANPFRNDSYVFVPYCTGDLHAGNNIVTYDATHLVWHRGYANMTAYLEWMVHRFPQLTRVTLVGSSAGGYGALINWAQTQTAFGTVRVDMIDDSGTPIPNRLLPAHSDIWRQMLTHWNLPATLPAGCSACLTDGFEALITYYAAAQPGDKAAYLTYQADSVLPAYYGLTNAEFSQALAGDRLLINAAPAHQHYFAVYRSGHILYFTPRVRAGAITLQNWLTAMANDDPAWQNAN